MAATTPARPQTNAEPHAGALYRQIGKVERLTPQQERSLAVRIERGDFQAKTLMIEANLRLVAKIAKSYVGLGLPDADVFQEGVVGLIRATEKFDYRKGYRFSTYASLWIREGMHRGLQTKGRLVYLPADVWRTASRIRRCRAALTARLGRDPSTREIASELGLSEEQVKVVTQAFRESISLHAPASSASEIELGEMLFDTNTPAPDHHADTAYLKAMVGRRLGALERKSREVIELRFGVGECSEACSVTEAARRLRIPRQQLRLLEKNAIARLAADGPLAAWAGSSDRTLQAA